MSKENINDQCSFVSIHYIICECGETFPSEDALRSHLEKEHPHKREKKEYKCGICSAIYSTEEECIQHYEKTHMLPDITEKDELDEYEEEKLDIASETLEAIEGIKQETLEDDEMILEGEEVELQIKPKKKGRGRKIIPKTEPDPEMVFVIQHGEKKGKLVNMLKKSGRMPKGQRTCACEICGKLYASHAALRYHQRTHTGERPYQCSICPKAFTMPLFLQIHVRTHTGERPYQCPQCPKAFSNKAALLRHERVHTGEKPYQCPMCAKTFTQSNSMKLHVTTVHLKQPTPYKSKNRKLKEEERLMSKKKVIPNPRKRVAAQVDSVEVLKNGLESYVLGPLKTDIDNLKTDIEMLARGEFEEQMNAVEMIERKDDDYEEEVLYEDDAEQYEVVLSH